MRTTSKDNETARRIMSEFTSEGLVLISRDEKVAILVLLAATAPLTNEDLAEIMADYCVGVLKVETDRAQIVASYMRDMESSEGHSYGRMVRYLADRLFGQVTP